MDPDAATARVPTRRPWSRRVRTVSRFVRDRILARPFRRAIVAFVSALALLILSPSLSGLIGGSGPMSADRFVRLLVSLGATGGHTADVTVIDIDDETMRGWGEPAAVPRDKLAGLLRQVAERSPLAVVVDVDTAADQLDPDGALVGFLDAYPQSSPPLLLVRGLRQLPGRGKPRDLLADEATRLDDLVASRGNMAWASALLRPDEHGLLRSWEPAQPVCGGQTRRVYGAVGLLSAAIQAGRLAEVRTALSMAGEAACKGRDAEIRFGERSLPEDVSIVYGFAWQAARGELGASFISRLGSPPFIRLSARDVTRAGRDLSAEAFSGRMVLVGGSFEAGRDIHRTPLGEMAGVYVLANVVANSLSALAPSLAARLATLAIATGLLVVYVLANRWLRLVPTLAVTALALGGVILGLALLGTDLFVILRVLQASLLLIGLFQAIETTLSALGARRRPDWRRALREYLLKPRTGTPLPSSHPSRSETRR